MCIHTIHFGRVDGTARKLAEHRAKLCLLGLKELQKSWDLENWVLDLFFRCLDDRTARDLRLADSSMPSSIPQTGGGLDIDDTAPATLSSGPPRTLLPGTTDNILPAPHTAPGHSIIEETAINMDWYELFNMEGDDVMGLAGSLSNPDYLNPQNLEFLYRFL